MCNLSMRSAIEELKTLVICLNRCLNGAVDHALNYAVVLSIILLHFPKCSPSLEPAPSHWSLAIDYAGILMQHPGLVTCSNLLVTVPEYRILTFSSDSIISLEPKQ